MADAPSSQSTCQKAPGGWQCSRETGHNGPCAAHPAETVEDRLREAEAHLWALVVWLGGEYEHPYVNRDMLAASAYVNQHLTDSAEMTARHREIIDRMGLR